MATCDPNEVIQACWACRSPQELQAAMVGLLCDISAGGGGGGVTSITAGTGISVDAATGAVTVTNTSGLPTGGTQGQIPVKHSGTNYDTVWKAQNPVEATLVDAAPIVWTVDPELADQKAVMTLVASRTLSFSGVAAGMSGRLKVIQGGAGNFSLTLPAGSKVANAGAGAVTLSTAVGATDILVWEYDGTNYWWVISLNFT